MNIIFLLKIKIKNMKKICVIVLPFLLFSCFWNNENATPIKTEVNAISGTVLNPIKTQELTWITNSWTKNHLTSTGDVLVKSFSWIDNISTWKTLSWNILSKTNNITTNSSVITNHSWYDFTTDDSIQKFVNNKVPFNNKKYIPNDLEKLSWDYITDAKNWQYLRHEALLNLQKMSKDFYDNFQEKLKIVSAYRSYEYQVWIKSRWCSDLLCAKAWYSEHQTGLAVDLFEASSKAEFLSKADLSNYFDWLNQNAYKYWFTNSYQKWLKVDWYAIEPWHWRYVWEDLATYLSENNLTLAEFVQK